MPRVIAALVMVVLYIGCASVPDVSFVRDGLEGGAGDGGGRDGGDGGGDGGGGDGGPAEAGPVMCGNAPLPSGAQCCGDTVACLGSCSSQRCVNDCSGRCVGDEICCRKPNGPNPNDVTVSCVLKNTPCQ